MNKLCRVCKITKHKSEFAKNNHTSKKDGLQTICKACSREKNKRWYEKNRLAKVHRSKTLRKEVVIKNRASLTAIIDKMGGCQLCGEKDHAVIDFHHVGKKNFNIATALHWGYSWNTILEELKCCICLCANCHRKVHAYNINIDNLAKCV